jgi:hypothetical protein
MLSIYESVLFAGAKPSNVAIFADQRWRSSNLTMFLPFGQDMRLWHGGRDYSYLRWFGDFTFFSDEYGEEEVFQAFKKLCESDIDSVNWHFGDHGNQLLLRLTRIAESLTIGALIRILGEVSRHPDKSFVFWIDACRAGALFRTALQRAEALYPSLKNARLTVVVTADKMDIALDLRTMSVGGGYWNAGSETHRALCRELGPCLHHGETCDQLAARLRRRLGSSVMVLRGGSTPVSDVFPNPCLGDIPAATLPDEYQYPLASDDRVLLSKLQAAGSDGAVTPAGNIVPIPAAVMAEFEKDRRRGIGTAANARCGTCCWAWDDLRSSPT